MPLRRLTMPSAMRVLGLLASVRALQFTPKARPSLRVFSSAETELTIDPIAVTTEGEYSANEMAPDVAVEKAERFRAINAKDMDKLADQYPRLKDKVVDIKRSALIFPFKASPYLVDELIDWDMAGDIGLDPFYKLVFPTMDMLTQEHQDLLNNACDEGDPKAIKATVEIIREALNPHPAGQKTLNAPKKAELTGVQHKYAETVLFFAAAAQTCHAYCTYCFRWAQFIGDADLRFAQKDADSLFDYLEEHEEVSDILFTGGDPMIMKTNMLKQYLEPFKDPDHLPHIKNLRIGTRALTFWPQRFTTDPDADSLIELLRDVKEVGGRHIAIMSHLSHYRELSTKKVQDAIHRLKQEGGVIIRSQSPVMAGINDDARVWNKKWKEEVRLGIIPYYMFIARDTGAQAYFNVPLVRAQKLYSEAIRSTSGLCRTARGPSMSCTPGKVEVVGVQEVQGTEAFVLRFLQCRDDEWIGKVFFAKFDPKALTQRLFLSFSELQVRIDGVCVVLRHRDAVEVAVRASTRRDAVVRRRRSGTTTSSRSRACRCPGRRRACRGPASTSPARSSGWTSSSSRCTRWRLFRGFGEALRVHPIPSPP